MRSPLLLGPLFAAACGAFAGWLVAGFVPDEIGAGAIDLHDQKYSDNGRWQEEPFVLDDTRRLPVLFSYADFDMQLEVELGEGVIVDVLARLVEPRAIGSELQPFHGRFSVLRLSADRAGPPWLTREEALLGDRAAGGVDLAPGHTATIWLRGRGRRLEANVAGIKLPAFRAMDTYGAFLIVARGGTAVVKRIEITPLGQPWAVLWTRWFWIALGAAVGLVAGALVLLLKSSAYAAGFALAFAGVFAWLFVPRSNTLLLHPPPAALFLMLGACGVAALSAAPKRAFLAVLAVVMILFFTPPLTVDESALDEVFGAAAGSQLSEAHAQLVRGPYMIHDAGPAEHRVFLLGGQLLYGRFHKGAPQEAHLEGLLAGDLAAALNVKAPQRVDVPCLWTSDGRTAQQWELFTRFYTGYRPDVIVFGVPDLEGEIDPETGRPRTYPTGLERTLAAARSYCREHDIGLVILADDGLSDELLAVLRAASERGVPLVRSEAGEDNASLSKRLAAAIAPLMQP